MTGRIPMLRPSNGQIFAYTVGTAGSLQAESTGYIPDNAIPPLPIYAIQANGKSWLYVLNEGDNANTTVSQSGIAAYLITNPFQASPIIGQTGAQAEPVPVLGAFLRIRPTSTSTPLISTPRR